MAELASSISPAYGYHRTSFTRISFTDPELLGPTKICTLHLHFILPSLIFVDPYELAHYEESYTFRHWGTSNLELPVTAVPRESAYLLLTVNATQSGTREVEVILPFHVRYGDVTRTSNSPSGYESTEIGWPTGFLACPRSGTLRINEHSQTNVEYFRKEAKPNVSDYIPRIPVDAAALLDPLTQIFIPVTVPNHPFTETVRVPVGNPKDLAFVEAGTVLTVLLVFVYLSRVSWIVANKISTKGVRRGKVE